MPFKHNPVNVNLQRFGRITTFNMDDGDFYTGGAQRLLEDEDQNPDIMLVQSFTGNVGDFALMSNTYRFHYVKRVYHAGVLVKQSSYCQVKRHEEERMNEFTNRRFTVFLKHCDGRTLVAISWNKTEGEIQEIQNFAIRMKDIYEAPVVIGGDFQLTAAEAIEQLPDEFIVSAPNEMVGIRAGKPNTDYFIFLPFDNLADQFVDPPITMLDITAFADANNAQDPEEN